jgi:hypothetical protein
MERPNNPGAEVNETLGELALHQVGADFGDSPIVAVTV